MFPGTKTGTRVRSPKPPFYETALLSPSEILHSRKFWAFADIVCMSNFSARWYSLSLGKCSPGGSYAVLVYQITTPLEKSTRHSWRQVIEFWGQHDFFFVQVTHSSLAKTVLDSAQDQHGVASCDFVNKIGKA